MYTGFANLLNGLVRIKPPSTGGFPLEARRVVGFPAYLAISYVWLRFPGGTCDRKGSRPRHMAEKFLYPPHPHATTGPAPSYLLLFKKAPLCAPIALSSPCDHPDLCQTASRELNGMSVLARRG